MIWPVDAPISQGYSAAHPANDLAGAMGVPIRAPESGVIVAVNNDPNVYFGGRYVVLQGDSGHRHYMGHTKANHVTLNQWVAEGQHIADVGMSGFAIPSKGISAPTGPHVHHEVSINGRTVDFKNLVGQVKGVNTMATLVDENIAADLAALGLFREGNAQTERTYINSIIGQPVEAVIAALVRSREHIAIQDRLNSLPALQKQVAELQDQLKGESLDADRIYSALEEIKTKLGVE